MSLIDGGPAFPCDRINGFDEKDGRIIPVTIQQPQPGMSLRDYLAAKAMQSVIMILVAGQAKPHSEIAVISYSIADAMLSQKGKVK